jgi:hypothetical protein
MPLFFRVCALKNQLMLRPVLAPNRQEQKPAKRPFFALKPPPGSGKFGQGLLGPSLWTKKG